MPEEKLGGKVEVTDNQRASPDLSGGEAARVSPSFGTEGRAKEGGVDFSGVSQALAGAVKTGAKIYSAEQEQEAQARADTVRAEFASDSFGLQADFLAGDYSSVAQTVLGIEDKGYSKEQLQKVKGYKGFVDKMEKARKAGKSDVAVNMAITRYRQRLIRENPSMTDDLLQIGTKVKSQTSNLRKKAFSDVEADRQRRQELKTEVFSTVRAMTGKDPEAFTEGERMELYNQYVKDKMDLQNKKNRAEEIKADNTISTEQKNQKISTYVEQGGIQELFSSLSVDATRIAQNEDIGAAEKQRQILELVQRSKSEVKSSLGITSDSALTERFGTVFNRIRDYGESVATGEFEESTISNKVSVMKKAAQSRVFGGEQGKKFLNFSTFLNELPDQTLSVYAQQESLVPVLTNILEDYNSNDVFGNYSPENDGGTGTGADGSEDLQAAPMNSEGKDVSVGQLKEQGQAVTKLLVTNRGLGKEDYARLKSLNGLAAISVFSDTHTSESLAAVQVVSNQTSDPKFVEEIANVEVPDSAIDTSRRFSRKVVRSGVELISEEANNMTVNVTEDGLMEFGQNNPNENSTRVKRFQHMWNNAVRTFAHLNKSTDYRAYSRKLWNDAKERLQSNG